MPTVCASCGAENGPQDAYCYGCGVELGRTTTPDAHPDEAVADSSMTEREQAPEEDDEDEDDADEDDAVAYSSESGQDT